MATGLLASAARAQRRAIGAMGRWYTRRRMSPRFRRDATPDVLLRSLARLYAHWELPNCVSILEALRVNDIELWKDAGTQECAACWHGHRLRLDLSDFYQRWAYFLSRYHEVPLQILLWRALRPGDTVIDGGANIGLVSMFASWRVGERGRVFAFEPNPRAFERLCWHVRENHIRSIECRPEGLSDEEAELLLQVPGRGNIGAGTFCPPPARYQQVTSDSAMARTIRGDQLDLPKTGIIAIKLDVEGFELRALRGMDRLIVSRHPLIITEVNREMLIAAGDSPFAMFSHLHERGYEGFGFTTERALVRHRRLHLWRVPGPGPAMPRDIAWIHPDSEAAQRLWRYIMQT